MVGDLDTRLPLKLSFESPAVTASAQRSSEYDELLQIVSKIESERHEQCAEGAMQLATLVDSLAGCSERAIRLGAFVRDTGTLDLLLDTLCDDDPVTVQQVRLLRLCSITRRLQQLFRAIHGRKKGP